MKLKCISIADDVVMPKYQTKGAAGLDVRAYQYSLPNDLEKAYDFPETGLNLKFMERVLIRTGLRFEIPEGYEMQVRGRGGHAIKYGVFTHVATVDSDYRGELLTVLINLSHDVFNIKKGDRVCQIVVNKIEKVEIERVEEFTDKTERGEQAINSTGII